MALWGSQPAVLRAIDVSPKDPAGYVSADQVSRLTEIAIDDIRDWLITLQDDGLVSLSRTTGGFQALMEARGRIGLREHLERLRDRKGSDAAAPEKEKSRIRPKGLVSFDKDDADFFLELLPGPYDREGLPDSISFWKVRIEGKDPDRTFRVGVIYGPSGCGKSSLVKAGLLPRLPDHILPVYVEATSDRTETALVRGVRRHCPDLPSGTGLVEALAALDEGSVIQTGRKILLVIDQFEQWLSKYRGEKGTVLVEALRHCDEERVQSVLMVRDDFLSPAIRFMEQVGIEFRAYENSRRLDLFRRPHAKKVLSVFGQAEGAIGDELTGDQQAFLNQAIDGLQTDGMIVPVRLAMFFGILRGRGWTTTTLKEIGDVEGVGVAFLEGTFSSGYADPRHRSHEEAAQLVLRALLPESDAEIKRARRPRRELLDASAYAPRPEKFEALLRILDNELRLITPVYQDVGQEDDDVRATGSVEPYYQLTHDYLVPSLRAWLARKNLDASQLMEKIRVAETKDVPALVKQLARHRHLANPLFYRSIAISNVDSKEKLHASMALLPEDVGQVEYLYHRLLMASPDELLVIRDGLEEHRERLVERLWKVLEQPEEEGQRLRAATALALYDRSNPRWHEVGGEVARAMVTVKPADLGTWLVALRPVRDKLTAPLATIFRDKGHPATERSLASNILEDYASDQPDLLADLVMESEEDHFTALLKKMEAHQETALPLLKEEMAKPLPEANDVEKDMMASRQARAAVALVRLGQAAEVWPKLRHSPDPRLRSFLVNWLAPLGVNPQEIVSALDQIEPVTNPTPGPGQQAMDAILFHPETSMRRALILALGTYGTKRLSPGERERLTARLLDLYRSDSDAGVHGAAEWTLRRWKQEEKLTALDAELSGLTDQDGRRWYVNGQGQTFAVIDGPVEFQMGSPETDPGHPELLHQRVIPRRFAIATKEVTVEHYQEFLAQNPKIERLGIDRYIPDPTGPRTRMTWYDATAYCNWLSEKEKFPKGQLCYEPSEGEYVEGMAIPRDVLERRGYRLPTEAEWEYACRAGALTNRSYGHSTDLLAKYARYSANSEEHAWPCGSLLPNDLGLFDMLGNVYEWCQEAYEDYRPDEKGRLTDIIDKLVYVNEKNSRLLRGGAFASRPAFIRSAFRGKDAPSSRDDVRGFRPARTVP